MEVSNIHAFFLGSGFGLKVAGHDPSKISKNQKIGQFVLSLIVTGLTAGLFFIAGPLIGRAVHNKKQDQLSNTDRKVTDRSSEILKPEKVLEKVPEKVPEEISKTDIAPISGKDASKAIDFSKITPVNIEQILDVTRDFEFETARVGEFFFDKRIHKNDDGSEKIEFNARMGFDATLPDEWGHVGIGVGAAGCGFEVTKENTFRIHENGTRDTYHTFDNLQGLFDHLLEGNFYQGAHFRATPQIIFKTARGEDITYKNRFYK